MTILNLGGRVELTGRKDETFTVTPGAVSATLYLSNCTHCEIDFSGFVFDLGRRTRAIEVDHLCHGLMLKNVKTIGGVNPIKVLKSGVDQPLLNLSLINVEILKPQKEGLYFGYSKVDLCLGGCINGLYLENIRVDGQEVMGDEKQGDGIDVKGVRDGIFRNVTIRNRRRGAMNLPGSSNIKMFNVHVENCLYGLRGSSNPRWPTNNITVHGITYESMQEQDIIVGPGIEVVDAPKPEPDPTLPDDSLTAIRDDLIDIVNRLGDVIGESEQP